MKGRPKKALRVRREAASASTGPRMIVLVGFMGAGKTSVGRALGRKLNWRFEDLDDRIEQREGRKIAEIFRESGEGEFRRSEHLALREMLADLQKEAGKVIALGGGAFVQQDNAELLRNAGVPVIFLDAPVEELWRRCCEQSGGAERPLLRSQEAFCELYEKRKSAYAVGSQRVETSGRSVDEIAQEIADNLLGNC